MIHIKRCATQTCSKSTTQYSTMFCIRCICKHVLQQLTVVPSVALQGVDCRRRRPSAVSSLSSVAFAASTTNCTLRLPALFRMQPDWTVSLEDFEAAVLLEVIASERPSSLRSVLTSVRSFCLTDLKMLPSWVSSSCSRSQLNQGISMLSQRQDLALLRCIEMRPHMAADIK